MMDRNPFAEVLSRAEEAARESRGGVRQDEAGELRCAVCGELLEEYVPELGRKMPVACACARDAEARRERRRRAEEARIRAHGSFWDPGYDRFTLREDDGAQAEASQVCRRYVENWEEMRREDLGLLFSGPMGTGKSFLAAAVVNALIEEGVPGVILTTSRLINQVRASREPQKLLDELNAFPLVALDDLGAERDTDYAVEVLESFVNSRVIARRPLLVTTNLTGEMLRRPGDLRYSRLFDRILALCPYPVILTGKSRREALGRERKRQMERLLGG